MTQSMVDTLSELCSPFLKGGNYAFIASIESATKQISVTPITTAQMAQIEIKWDLISKI